MSIQHCCLCGSFMSSVEANYVDTDIHVCKQHRRWIYRYEKHTGIISWEVAYFE